MRRHPTDLVGLIFGTAFTIAGVAFLVNEATDTNVNPAWATGLGLMLLGAVALIATLMRGLRHQDDEPAHYDAWQYSSSPYAFSREATPAPETEAPTTEAVATPSED